MTSLATDTSTHPRLIGASRGLSAQQWIVPTLFATALALFVLSLTSPAAFASLVKVPGWFSVPVSAFLSDVVAGFSAAFRWLIRPMAEMVDWQIKAVDRMLSGIPWPVVTLAAVLVTWRSAGARLACLAAFVGVYIAAMGYWSESIKTITLVLFALPAACVVGFLLGLLAHAYRAIARAIDALLSFVQTVPAFAYLVPLIVLFGFGPVPGVIASLLYAAPAMARNVQFGLDNAPSSIIEAADMAGCTRTQTFFLVRLPAARSRLFVGLNQTIMACLSMVIFAAAIGGFEDLGWEVLRAARKAEFGNGFISGSIITLLAILLDRATSAAPNRAAQATGLSRRGFSILLVLLLTLAWFVSTLPAFQEAMQAARGLRPAFAGWLDSIVLWITVSLEPLTKAVSTSVTYWLLLPLRAGAARALPADLFGTYTALILPMAYAAFSAAATLYAQRRWKLGPETLVALGVLYTGFLSVPWAPFVALVSLIAYRLRGIAGAVKVLAILLFIAISGMWLSAMFALYFCIAAMIACIVIGGGLGIAASQSELVSRVMRPVNDFLQTIPPFVILIPVIIFFGVGDFSSFVAIVAYSVAAMARYTEHGLRSVPATLLEAGEMAGCTRLQSLFLVQLPAASRAILLGVSQTFMYCLAMLAVAALVGARGLGQDVYVALGKADAGLGILAGGCIALIALAINELLIGGRPERA